MLVLAKISTLLACSQMLAKIILYPYYLTDKPLKEESVSPTFIRTNLLELSVRPTVTLTAELTAYEYHYFVILLMSFVDLQI